MKRQITLVFILFTFLAGLVPFPAFAVQQPSSIPVFIDELPVNFDVPPVIKNGRTLVPFRAISEALNIKVQWDDKTRQITATNANTVVILRIGNQTAYIDGSPVLLEVPPQIVKSRTLIPLRFFSEAFSCKVSWDPAKSTVKITSPPTEMTVIGFYALGDTKTSSWEDLFGLPYPDSFTGNTDVVSDLALGWYSLNQSGELITDSTTGWKKPFGWEDVLENAAKYNLKTEMTVHITDKNSAIMNILTNKTSVNNAVKAISDEALLYNGVNLNFEGLGLNESGEQLQSTRSSFTNFVTLLAEELHKSNKHLTLTIHAPNSSYPGYDYKALGQAADRIVIMAHDYGPKPEPISLVTQAVELAVKQVPPQKLLLGISLPSETEESVMAKIGIAKRYGLKGISLWRLGLVSDKTWDSFREVIKPRD